MKLTCTLCLFILIYGIDPDQLLSPAETIACSIIAHLN